MRVGGVLVAALGLVGLGGCAQIQCFSATDRGACHAAYQDYENCQAANRPLVRHVGDRPVQSCVREQPRDCRYDRKGRRNCYPVIVERCTTRWEPVYDYREFNQGVQACMHHVGQGAYATRFMGY